MAKVTAHIAHFSVGEFSDAGLARIDYEGTRLAAETQENILPHTIGKGLCRPGTEYIVGTENNERPRLLPFVRAIDDFAMLCLTDGKLRVLVDDAYVTRPSVTSTVINGDFSSAAITGVTQANPAVVTAVGHGFSNGTVINIQNVVGMTELNENTYTVANKTDDTFELSGINSTAYTAYTSGGDATDWTLTISSGAQSTIFNGILAMHAAARGSEASCERSVTTSSAGTEHALEIDVSRGPVLFQCGSTSGAQDYISQTTLGTGNHSLSFTPSGTYYVTFITREPRFCIVNSISVASSGIMEIDGPWTTATLRSLAFDQSADIVFLADSTWKPRKIERRSTTSWSVVEYDTDDGPFLVSSTQSISMTSASNIGNTTVTANKAVFSADHLGSLIRLYHEDFNSAVTLAGDPQYSEVFTVRGIKHANANFNDRDFDYNISGTWVGTLRVSRSVTGPNGDFVHHSKASGAPAIDITSNVTATHASEDDDNNVISYTRIGFDTGEYTSGKAVVAISYDGFSGYGVGRIVTVNSATSVDVEVLEPFNATSATTSWSLGAWSTKTEFPSAVAFYDGRLWWGGLDSFWASASDAYYTFDDLEEGDGATIQRKVATGGQVSTVNWFLPLARLIIGTSGAEAVVKSSSFDEPLTPQNVTLKDASTLGSADVSPVKIDNRGLFVHRSGVSAHAVFYSFEANDFTTDDLTELNEDICGDGILEMAVQREPENYVWCVREDGQLALLIYDWSETRQAKGWSRVILGGTDVEVESVCVLPGAEQDRVYFAVARTIDGSTVRYIEKLSKHSEAKCGSTHKMGDSGVFTAASSSTIVAAHLANETGIVGWGTKDGAQYPLTGLSADGSGNIALGDTYTNTWVGLGYDCKYKSSRLAYGAQNGTALLQKKRVTQLGLLLANTHRDAISFGADFTNMTKMSRIKGGVPTTATTVYDKYDATTFSFPGKYDTDSRVCLKVSAPYGATLLGLVFGVETHEK